ILSLRKADAQTCERGHSVAGVTVIKRTRRIAMTPITPAFPALRLRRTRATPALRALVRQTHMDPSDFILPMFVQAGKDTESVIPSMPGVTRKSVDRIVTAAKDAYALGIPAVCLFPYTSMDARTEDCAAAWSDDNLSNQAIRAIKDAVPEMAVMTDIALDP